MFGEYNTSVVLECDFLLPRDSSRARSGVTAASRVLSSSEGRQSHPGSLAGQMGRSLNTKQIRVKSKQNQASANRI